jgi:hypothetical protein
METPESASPEQPAASEPAAEQPVAPGPPSDATVVARPAAAAVASYEFGAEQNETILALSTAMRGVGLYLLAAGILFAILGVVSLLRGTPGNIGNGLVFLLQGALNVIIGVWTRGAGNYFNSVATTTGADIRNLMDALGELRRIYGLQLVIIIVALVLFALAMIIAVGAAVMHARG